MASRATVMSSAQPMETAAMPGMSPTMVRAALTSSSASRPWVTTTIPITIASGRDGAPSPWYPLSDSRSGDGVGDHHRAVPPARAADARSVR